MVAQHRGQGWIRCPGGRAGALTWRLKLVADEGEQLSEGVTVGHGPRQEAVVDAGSFQEQVRAGWEVWSLQGQGKEVREEQRSRVLCENSSV